PAQKILEVGLAALDQRIPPAHVHLERLRLLTEAAADATPADDGDLRAGEAMRHAGGEVVPLAGLHGAVLLEQASAPGDEQRKGVVGDLLGAVAGDVVYGDAAGLCGLDVDVVRAGAGGGDHPEIGHPRDVVSAD